MKSRPTLTTAITFFSDGNGKQAKDLIKVLRSVDQPVPPQPHPQPGPSLSQHRRARQQERQIQQMFSAQGMQPDWGSFFGGGRGGFQGM